MALSLTALLFVTCLKIQLVHNQYWSNYGSCDPYGYYGYGQPQYIQRGYSSPYSQPGYEYYQSYNPHRSEPTVIILENRDDDDWEWVEFLNFISSQQNQPNSPVYIPYLVPMDNCDNDGCPDCGCKNRGCGCPSKCENYDTCSNGCDSNCGCRNQDSCNCKSGKGCSDNCGCKKNVIKHKCDCCCCL